MEKVMLDAEQREVFKKGGCKHLREEGKIPGVVYKAGKKGTSIHIDAKALGQALHTEAGENAIITLNISAGEKPSKKTVIVQEIQRNPLSEKYVHVDFHEISLTEKLKVSVPVNVKGEAVGVTEEKGVLTQVLWELEVECLPTAIPEHLDVRVEELRIGDAIHIEEMEAPEGVTFLEEPETVVVSVSPPAAEEEEAVVEEEGAEEGEEPELIKKGKKEEEEGEEPEKEAAPEA
ncbi:MAG: 50S ribosomal protein L25 [Candidatus Aadella gelida]|nr:50S ribosomal protein L25 [Candidatus Aadella gelida]